MADTGQPDVPAEPQGRHVTYCGVCTLPPEYCEYGGTVKKCQEWLQKNNREMYDRIWSAGMLHCPNHCLPRRVTDRNTPEALEAATASLSVEAQKRAAKDAQKKAAKAEAAEAKHADKLAKSVVTIKRIERNKKKFVTAVIGLEAFGLELKKVAKDLGKKFATGSSVTKVPSGGEEIVVQGDVSEEVEEFLLEKYKEIPEDNIELVDDKKKKKAAAAAAGGAG
ncbi:Translation machinery-associated protein 22 [Tolypocladium paradoxum]|uniref:Translation machinery-associated protein 22 n=1 Tax=Tolypocladium paradoxum TaxID=94208 RepID=A0A2S4KMC7_9HYPO|nr:Translation machinery-associated protein 22 [Tolypocladium paradoxum]